MTTKSVYALIVIAIYVLNIAIADIIIATGGASVCALGVTSLYCFGDNTNEKLINGLMDSILEQPTLVKLNIQATKVALGTNHICIVAKDQGVFCKGDDSVGQCGIGITPNKVVEFQKIPTLTNADSILRLYAGDQSTCVITISSLNIHNLLCWGATIPNVAPLGIPTLQSLPLSPIEVSVRQTKGTILNDLTEQQYLKVNDFGQLGSNTTVDVASPVSQVLGLTSGSQSEVSVGAKHICLLSISGGVSCAGQNKFGQLGLGDFIDRPYFTQIPFSQEIIQVACGDYFTCFVTKNGKLFCFGSNSNGQLGVGDYLHRPSPALVSFLNAVVGVSSITLGESQVFAVMADGSVQVWGDNSKSQLGLGQTFAGINVTTPQSNDKLTSISRNELSIPPVSKAFIAYLSITFFGFLVFFISECIIGETKAKYEKEMRKVNRENLNLRRVKDGREVKKGLEEFESDPIMVELRNQCIPLLTNWKKIAEKRMEYRKQGNDEDACRLYENHALQYRLHSLKIMCQISRQLKKNDQPREHHISAKDIKRILTVLNACCLELNEKKKSAFEQCTNFLPKINDTPFRLTKTITITDFTDYALWNFFQKDINLHYLLERKAQGLIPLFPMKPKETKKNSKVELSKKPSTKDAEIIAGGHAAPRGVNSGSEEQSRNVIVVEEKADEPPNVERKTSKVPVVQVVKTEAIGWFEIITQKFIQLIIRIWTAFKREFHFIADYRAFYSFILLSLLTIFLVFASQSALEAQDKFGKRPGGMGASFFPFPPYYDVRRPFQSEHITLVYGFMHCALFLLGLLPIPMMKGAWRILLRIKSEQKRLDFLDYIPVNDLNLVHKIFGWGILFFLFCGVLTFLSIMSIECIFSDEARACTAFTLLKFDPSSDVVALRLTVWPLWFWIMPLMYFARRPAPAILEFIFCCVPLLRPIKQYWWEMCYYLHITIAYISILLALICRFPVFYPILISWIPYFIDLFLERFVNSYNCEIDFARFKVFWDQKKKPTAMVIVLKVKGNSSFKSGQWVYLRRTDSYLTVSHPFSIANAPEDKDEVELLIGIQGLLSTPRSDEDSMYKKWIPDNEPLLSNEMKYRTWTGSLFNDLVSEKEKELQIQGPYGSAFEKCFEVGAYDAVVAIGAGTGLTAAESVLRRMIDRGKGLGTPSVFWFVWSCRTLDDLFWCWKVLVRALVSKAGDRLHNVINFAASTDESDMLDWIGITIYVTKVDNFDELVEFKKKVSNLIYEEGEEDFNRPPTFNNQANDQNQNNGNEKQKYYEYVTRFLIGQIIPNSPDEEECHISHLLKGVLTKTNQVILGKPKMAVAYCGQPAFASVIRKATEELKRVDDGLDDRSVVEFSEDGQ